MDYSYNCLRLTVALTLSLLVSILQIVSVSSITDRPCHFPAIFNFGDSNSDTGGLSAAFGPAPSPNGVTFFHAPAGRFSDGRLIIDFIAEKLRLPFLNAYLDAVGSNFTHGANFATAGSTIREQNTTRSQPGGFSPMFLNVQFYQYAEFTTRSQTTRRREGIFRELLPKQEDFSAALYTFDIGQNDLAAGYFLNMSTEQVREYVPDVLYNFSTTLKNIYGEGGRYFWIHNTGPLGCLPYILDGFQNITAGQIDDVGCASPFNEVAQFFNRGLKETVVQLRRDLPFASITYVDIYSVKYSLICEAKKHGFLQPLRACCGHGGRYNYNKENGCGKVITANGTKTMIGSCKDPRARINWDGVHYTEAANRFVFDQIVDGSFSDPPIPLIMACHSRQQTH